MEDEETPEPIPTPVLDEHDAAAVFGMLIRIIRMDDADERDQALLDQLRDQLGKRAKVRPKLLAALDSYGFQIEDDRIWTRVREALGLRKYQEAFQIARSEPPSHDASIGSKEVHHEQAISKGAVSAGQERNATEATPKISAAILEYLRSIPGRGAQVAEIKKHLLDQHGIATHEKTPGMTLYRLSKDKLVRRDGRTWFPVEFSGGGSRVEHLSPSEDKFPGLQTNTAADQ